MKEIMKEVITKLKEADAVLIGASNGLSISEGLHLFAENQTFMELFSVILPASIMCSFPGSSWGSMGYTPSKSE